MDNKNVCDVGFITNSECHISTFTNDISLYQLDTLASEEIALLKYRIENFHSISKGTICGHHKCKF